MRSYFLIDGAMIYDVIRAQHPMQQQDVDWRLPLLPNKTDDLIGPLLFDTALVKAAGEAVNTCMAKLIIAFPSRQHLSTIYSDADLVTLAQHLRRFAAFNADDGKTLAFRFADCRRLVDLPLVLTDEQWGDMTSLMAHWHCHDRQGKEMALRLSSERAAMQSDHVFRLDDRQLRVMERLAEPDQLAHTLVEEQTQPGTPVQHYNWACKVITMLARFQHRDVTLQHDLGRLAFATGGAFLEHPDLPALLSQADSLAIRRALQDRFYQIR